MLLLAALLACNSKGKTKDDPIVMDLAEVIAKTKSEKLLQRWVKVTGEVNVGHNGDGSADPMLCDPKRGSSYSRSDQCAQCRPHSLSDRLARSDGARMTLLCMPLRYGNGAVGLTKCEQVQ